MPFDVRTSETPGRLRTGGRGTGAGETEPQNTSKATTEVGVYSGFHRKTERFQRAVRWYHQISFLET